MASWAANALKSLAEAGLNEPVDLLQMLCGHCANLSWGELGSDGGQRLFSNIPALWKSAQKCTLCRIILSELVKVAYLDESYAPEDAKPPKIYDPDAESQTSIVLHFEDGLIDILLEDLVLEPDSGISVPMHRFTNPLKIFTDQGMAL